MSKIKDKEKEKDLYVENADFGINIKYKEFEYINDRGRVRYGVDPIELELVNPEFVFTDFRGDKDILYIDFLVKEVAALKEEIRLLKKK